MREKPQQQTQTIIHKQLQGHLTFKKCPDDLLKKLPIRHRNKSQNVLSNWFQDGKLNETKTKMKSIIEKGNQISLDKNIRIKQKRDIWFWKERLRGALENQNQRKISVQ